MAEVHYSLIEACKKRNEKAQLELYQLLYRGVYNTCFRILRRQDEAEDAMQDTFIKAFDKIGSLSTTTPPEAWLRRIAVNTSIDVLRKKRLELLELNEHRIEAVEEDTEDYSETLLRVDAIKRGIDELPQGFRLVLSLHLIEGYDYEEVAEILRVSPSTVRSQYVRGKKRLLEMLQGNG